MKLNELINNLMEINELNDEFNICQLRGLYMVVDNFGAFNLIIFYLKILNKINGSKGN